MDGLGPYEIKKIRAAIRLVWQRSLARKLVVTRCMGFDGFPRCEMCGAKTAQLKVDHIEPVGDLDGGFIARLFTPSRNLQGLCKEHHDEKTKAERKAKQPKRVIRGFK